MWWVATQSPLPTRGQRKGKGITRWTDPKHEALESALLRALGSLRQLFKSLPHPEFLKRDSATEPGWRI